MQSDLSVQASEIALLKANEKRMMRDGSDYREKVINSFIQASEASYRIITRLKKAVVCSTTPPRSLVLPGPKGVQSVLGGWENVVKGSWTSPS